MKKIKTPVVLGLLLTLAGSATQAVRAEDKPSTPAATAPATPAKPVQQQLAGTVKAVDKYNKTITLQVGDLTYVLQVADSTQVSNKAGKQQNITDVVVGEELSVNVQLRQLPNGQVEIALLSVQRQETAEAQGRHGNKGRGHGKNVTPFGNNSNGSSIDGRPRGPQQPPVSVHF